mmetsp:Transcript_37523/g.105968  ORF Transcript_37523/g.105968 Transcript_37523/m.105968 type:complete len:249 (+) Transcript_37523:177-923(+)
MGQQALLLSVLGYPQASAYSACDVHQFRNLVRWLENSKIRHWQIAERDVISDVNHPQWDESFSKYLGEVGFGSNWDVSQAAQVSEWLAAFAVGLKYEERAEEYNKLSATSTDPARPAEKSPQKHMFPDVDSPEFSEAVHNICAQLKIEPTGDLLADLKVVNQLLSEAVLPASKVGPGNGSESMHTTAVDFPLGFSTGDDGVDTAAKVLRMLYIKDLRELQTQIDHAIVSMQELTADPKTDATLGKVGY